MINHLKGHVKVKGNIKPLPRKDRKAPKLIIGKNYYVSFGSNFSYPCTLLEIINEFKNTEVLIGFPMKLRRRGGIEINDKKYVQTNLLYATEIGITPEDAVKNSV